MSCHKNRCIRGFRPYTAQAQLHMLVHLEKFDLVNAGIVKPVLSDHIKQDIFWVFRQVVAYCCTLSVLL